MPESNDPDEAGDEETQSVATRWRFTNDVAAGVIVCAVYTIRLTVGDAGPVTWATDLVLPGLAGVWLFGRGALAGLKELLGS